MYISCISIKFLKKVHLFIYCWNKFCFFSPALFLSLPLSHSPSPSIQLSLSSLSLSPSFPFSFSPNFTHWHLADFFLIVVERWRKVFILFSVSMFLNLTRIIFLIGVYSTRRGRVYKFNRNKAKWIILCLSQGWQVLAG